MTDSTFLNQIGLGGFDLGYLLIGMAVAILLLLIFLILLIVQIRKTSKLKKRLDKFLTGKDGTSLEQDIAGLYEDNKFLKANTEKNKKDIRTLYKNMESAYQKMGLVKYDAFNQMGGQLSFSLALLDENNNGFIINSVHSSEGCYSYTKEIKLGQCAIDLGSEEAEALSIAMGGIKEEVAYEENEAERADRKRNSCTVIDDLGLSDHSSGRRSIKKRVYF